MVMRIDHTRAKFPPPSEELFEGMARRAYKEFCVFWNDLDLSSERVSPQSWDALDSDRKMVWHSTMRAVWKHMAIQGGAKRKRCP